MLVTVWLIFGVSQFLLLCVLTVIKKKKLLLPALITSSGLCPALLVLDLEIS